MKNYRGVGLLVASASLALAAGAHGAPAATAEPGHPSLGFLKFTVTDLPAMQAFYEKAFGMRLQKHLENPGNPGNTEVILTTPAGMDLALVHYKDNRKVTPGNANGPIGFYLSAAEVDAAYKSAMAAGATSRSGPGGGKGVHVAIVTDPEGHDIELLHLD
jgi:lactoylglutathione lyase